jgi:hypothetical protein
MSDFDKLSKESADLSLQIKELNDRRTSISKQLLGMMMEYGYDYRNNSTGQSVLLAPHISPSLSEITKEEKKKIIDWLYINEPDCLTVIHTRLPQIVMERGTEFPVEMTTDGFLLKVYNRVVTRDPIPLSEIKIKPRGKTERRLKKDTWKKKEESILVDEKPLSKTEYELYSQPLSGDEIVKTWSMTTEEIKVDRVRKNRIKTAEDVDRIVDEYKAKQAIIDAPKTHSGLTRQQQIERKADIIQRYMNGEKKSHIANIYNLSGSYVGEILKKHERQLLKEIIKDNKLKKEKDEQPPMVSINI